MKLRLIVTMEYEYKPEYYDEDNIEAAAKLDEKTFNDDGES